VRIQPTLRFPFLFSNRLHSGLLGRWMGLFVVFSLVAVGCSRGPEPVRRVLIVTLDTLRADALACYEFDATCAHTPNLDRLAARGTLFRRATCQIPATLTSHTAIMSGRLPRSTGVRFASDSVPEEVVTLAEVCRDNGFLTAAFISSAVLEDTFGLNQGFDLYADLSTEIDNQEAERSAQETTNLALEWLAEQPPGEPILLWVHYYDAHSPYEPLAEDDVFGPEGYEGPIDGSADQITKLIATEGAGLDPMDLARLRALYLGEVNRVDRELGRLLEAFETRSADTRDLVVVVSDHGENLGEGGRFFHGADLFETCMHVPLIVRWPGGKWSGTEVEDLVMAMDVMPTVLSACGLPVPEDVEAEDLHLYLASKDDPTIVEPSSRVGLLETEHAYLSDADKELGAVTLEWKLVDRRHCRREPVLVGRPAGIPLRESCYLRGFVRGDPTATLAVHIRFLAPPAQSNSNTSAIESQPTILVSASRFGNEPIHLRHSLPEVPEGWTIVGTTDLHRRAIEYGKAQGWPLENIVIESVAVNVGGVPGQRIVDAWVDNLALVGEQTRVLDDFEDEETQPYQDAGVGMKHIAGSRVEAGEGVEGSAALHVVAKYPPGELVWERSDLYYFDDPFHPTEKEIEFDAGDVPDRVLELGGYIENWLQTPPGTARPATIDERTENALKGLGYL